MLRNIIGPGFDSRNVFFFCLCFCSFFFKISFSLQKEEDFWKTKKKKKKKRKLGPGFDSKKGKSWTRFWLYSIYIYIYLSLYVCLDLFLYRDDRAMAHSHYKKRSWLLHVVKCHSCQAWLFWACMTDVFFVFLDSKGFSKQPRMTIGLRKSWPPRSPETPKIFKVTRKWLKRDFRGLPLQTNPKSNPKSNLVTRKCHFWGTFSGQKFTFGVTF